MPILELLRRAEEAIAIARMAEDSVLIDQSIEQAAMLLWAASMERATLHRGAPHE